MTLKWSDLRRLTLFSLPLAWTSLELLKVFYSYLQLFLEVPAELLFSVKWSNLSLMHAALGEPKASTKIK